MEIVRVEMSSSVRLVDALGQILGALFLLLWAVVRTMAKIFDYMFKVAMSLLSP